MGLLCFQFKILNTIKMINYNQDLTDKVFQMYIENGIGKNKICALCKNHAARKRKNLTHGPVPIFHIGKDYPDSKKKILFVGKVAYGWNEINSIWDETPELVKTKIPNIVEDRIKDLFFNERRYHEDERQYRFFSYMKKACEQVFGDERAGYNRICISNFVHCNNGAVRDNLPQAVRKSCASIEENGYLHKEIAILNPTHIIVLTNDSKYKRYVEGLYGSKILCLTHPSSSTGNLGIHGFAKKVKEFVEAN